MAMKLRRRRRRIHIEGWGDAPRPFCVTRVSDPFGDIDPPAYGAVRNLTESGELPELFAELPNAHSDEIADFPRSSRGSLLATEVTAPASRIVAEPMP
jgi:hypothetical protein